MKRFLISFLGLALFLGVSAQDNCDKERGERKNPLAGLSAEQKAQTITDRMVGAYGLSAEQRAKLLDLNTRKLDQCPDKPCGKGQKKECPGKKDKKCKKNKPCPQQQGKPSGKHGGIAYMRELKGIMTAEQFKAYMTDRAIERQMFGKESVPRHPKMKRGSGKADCGRPCDCKRG